METEKNRKQSMDTKAKISKFVHMGMQEKEALKQQEKELNKMLYEKDD